MKNQKLIRLAIIFVLGFLTVAFVAGCGNKEEKKELTAGMYFDLENEARAQGSGNEARYKEEVAKINEQLRIINKQYQQNKSGIDSKIKEYYNARVNLSSGATYTTMMGQPSFMQEQSASLNLSGQSTTGEIQG